MQMAGATDTRANATAIAPFLKERASEIEEARRLPADLAETFAKLGFFRMVTPKAYGGLEKSPREIVETTETLAKGDASAAWCVMIGATTALNAAYMSPAAAAEVYSDPRIITGGVFAPMGKAVKEGDTYRVSGRWQWASGSANCSWLCGGAVIIEDGEMRRLPNGAPDHRMMVFPRKDAELIDTWHTSGLKGTGSGDMVVSEIVVPHARSVSLITDKPQVGGALYAFPAFGLLSVGVCSVALGNARGALNDIIELANAKKSQGSNRTLAERPVIQTDIAKAEASLRSARAFLMEAIESTWETAQETGEIPVEQRAELRLACTHVTRTAADVCRTAYDIGGGASVFLSNSLQRRFRDAHTATQHIVTAPTTYELTGRVLLGLPTDAGML